MFETVIVPVDGSEESARALRPASAVAHYLDTDVRIVAFHDPRDDGFELTERVRHQADACGDFQRKVDVAPLTRPVAELLTAVLDDAPNALVVMSTRGHGRSAAVLGSVANDILSITRTPVLLVGPNCEPGRFRLHGRMLVPVSGDPLTPTAAALARELVEAFDFTPEVVQVIDPDVSTSLNRMRSGPAGGDLPPESATAHHVAREIAGGDTDFTVLHDAHAGEAIARHAGEVSATLIAMPTNARRGLERLRLGSVTAQVITHAPCPVITVGPGE